MYLTPLKSIRKKCLQCMSGHYKEIRLCPSENCPLYQYRMGKNPKIVEIAKKRMSFFVAGKKTRFNNTEKSP